MLPADLTTKTLEPRNQTTHVNQKHHCNTNHASLLAFPHGYAHVGQLICPASPIFARCRASAQLHRRRCRTIAKSHVTGRWSHQKLTAFGLVCVANQRYTSLRTDFSVIKGRFGGSAVTQAHNNILHASDIPVACVASRIRVCWCSCSPQTGCPKSECQISFHSSKRIADCCSPLPPMLRLLVVSVVITCFCPKLGTVDEAECCGMRRGYVCVRVDVLYINVWQRVSIKTGM